MYDKIMYALKYSKKIQISIIFGILFLFIIVLINNIISLFFTQDSLLVPNKYILKIKKEVSTYRNSTLDDILLSKVEGSNKTLSLVFKENIRDNNSSLNNNNYYVLYDVKEKEPYYSLKYNGLDISYRNISYVSYIKDTYFIVIDTSGNLYIFNSEVSKNKDNLSFIGNIDIKKESIFLDLLYKDTLYIACRNTTNLYNEKSFDNNVLYKINTSSIHKNKLIIDKINYDNDMIIDFVNNNDEINVVFASSINLLIEDVKKFISNSKYKYIEHLPYKNNHYRFIDTKNIYIDDLKGNKTLLTDSFLHLEKNDFYDKINSLYNVDLSYASNVPILINKDNNIFYINKPYNLYLSTNINNSKNHIVGVYDTANNNFSSPLNSANKVKLISHKKIAALLDDGAKTYILNKNFEISELTDKSNIYLNNSYYLYVINDNIYINKIH